MTTPSCQIAPNPIPLLIQLPDVDITGIVTGNTLVYNTVTKKWTPSSAGTGTVSSVGVSSTDLSVSGSPVTTSGTITLNINNQAVTYAKIQNISATNRLLGRATAGAGVTEEITIGSGLTLTGTTLSVTAGGVGTVTDVSVVTANGVSGSVATSTTTPAITLTLGAITPTSVNGLTISTTNGTLTLANGSTLATSGANSITLTSAGATNVTLPTSGTLATLAGSETLSNKILTAPKIANAGFIADANGNEQIVFTTTASAVNEITLKNAATANAVEIQATGGDTNVSTKFVPKGTGVFFGVQETFIIAISDETTAITTGNAKATFRIPYAFKVLKVRASLTTFSTSGTPTFDINESGVSILSTKITIDVNETTSVTAAVPPVISDDALAENAEITIDIDVAGTGATGAKIYIIGYATGQAG